MCFDVFFQNVIVFFSEVALGLKFEVCRLVWAGLVRGVVVYK